jgi:hypothetical protein
VIPDFFSVPARRPLAHTARPLHFHFATAELPRADVDDRRPKTRGFDNSARAVADEDSGITQEREIRRTRDVAEGKIVRRTTERNPAPRDPARAGIVVWMNNDDAWKPDRFDGTLNLTRPRVFDLVIRPRTDATRPVRSRAASGLLEACRLPAIFPSIPGVPTRFTRHRSSPSRNDPIRAVLRRGKVHRERVS